MLTLSDLGQNACLRALFFKTANRAIQRFVFANLDLRQLLSLPSIPTCTTTCRDARENTYICFNPRPRAGGDYFKMLF